jgi:hypothetical protein
MNGQGLVEYALILVGVAIVVIAVDWSRSRECFL